jgi:hypothetical protein
MGSMVWLGFAILALVLWGITGVTQKLSTNRISSERSFLWFCWAMVALVRGCAPCRQAALGNGTHGPGLFSGWGCTQRTGRLDQFSRA